jgi:hypothetical protein
MSTEATIKTLDHAWKTFESLNTPMAVMGGLALVKWKRFRATKDVDLLVDAGDLPAAELVRRLQQAGFRSKRSDPLIRLTNAEFVQLWYEPPDTSSMCRSISCWLELHFRKKQLLDAYVSLPTKWVLKLL